MTTTLKRETFETSRLSEYFTEKELRAQIGFQPEFWPIAILRELVDNSLDATEEHIAPVIEITIADDIMSVQDNGPGIPVKVVDRSLDYLYRVSNKAYYIAPTRGQMGNALKVIYAAPYVMAGKGHVQIIASGTKHDITVRHDRITGEPDIEHKKEAFVKNGTFVKIEWENSTRLLLDPNGYYNPFFTPPTPGELVAGYAAFNPHATFILNGHHYEATNKEWQKWTSAMPTPAHWYGQETLRDLIAGNLSIERNNGHQKTVREFVSEFRGLSSTAKQKKVTGDYARERLIDFEQDGDIDLDRLTGLLDAMKSESKPPKPATLGVIGRDHFTSWMISMGAQDIKYSKKQGTDADGMPFIVEVGFAVNKDRDKGRILATGINWSPVIGSMPDQSISSTLQFSRVDVSDPAIILIHISQPRIEFMDRGKTKTQLRVSSSIESAMKSVTKGWKAAKRKADRNDRVSEREIRRMHQKAQKVSLRDAAFQSMQEAYNKVSSNGIYFANARQIMYAARPYILQVTGKEDLDSVYFTQTLLKDYIEENSKHDWKVVWDARGHLIEPHTNKSVGLGGREVMDYVKGWSYNTSIPQLPEGIETSGPKNRFKNILFIEKEGFTEILTHANIPERYDMAIMSTKGIPVAAACDLIAELQDQGGQAYILHDFDLEGFKITRTLRNGTRLSSGSDVIDLGLRGQDVEDLQSEPVYYKQKADPRLYLRECGANMDEAYNLVSHQTMTGYRGRRVEINAMTSEQLIKWLESKFKEHGIEKVIPDEETLVDAYKRAMAVREINKMIARMAIEHQAIDTDIPEGLVGQVRAAIEQDPTLSWDQAVYNLLESNAK